VVPRPRRRPAHQESIQQGPGGFGGDGQAWRQARHHLTEAIPPHGQRFDYVHILLDCVPPQRRADLIRHHLASTIRPGTGWLLVSDYAAATAVGVPAAARTRQSLGFACGGQTSGGERPGPAPGPGRVDRRSAVAAADR